MTVKEDTFCTTFLSLNFLYSAARVLFTFFCFKLKLTSHCMVAVLMTSVSCLETQLVARLWDTSQLYLVYARTIIIMIIDRFLGSALDSMNNHNNYCTYTIIL